MILFAIIMSILGAGAVLGICYLFYEIINDALHPPEKKIEEIPQSTNLRFKKPKL